MDKSKSPSKRSPILLPVLNHHRYISSSTLKSSLKHTSLSPDRKKINRPENSPIKNNYRRSISPVISPYKAQVSYNLSDLNFGKCLGRGKQGRVVLAQMDQKEYAVKILQKDEKKTGELE